MFSVFTDLYDRFDTQTSHNRYHSKKIGITPSFSFFSFFRNTQEEIVRDSFRYIPSIVLAKIPRPPSSFNSVSVSLFDFLDFILLLLRPSSPLRFLAITAKSDCSADKTFKRDIYIYVCIYIRGHSLHEIAPRNCLSSYDSR